MMAPGWVAACLVSCSGPVEAPPETGIEIETAEETGTPVPEPDPIRVDLGPVWVLTDPGGGLLQSRATVAWGDDRFLVAFAAGHEPATRASARAFLADGTPIAPAFALHPETAVGDKPDVEWDGQDWVVAWTDGGGRVRLATIGTDGVLGASRLLYQGEVVTDAVDLAVQPDGSGIAIWTEYAATVPPTDDGRIVWRGFDPDRGGDGPPYLADSSSRKTSDASPLPGGGWVGVWARDVELAGTVSYEVWGRLYRPDGTAWTFRADDLDTAWPSRPAVAASADGILAVGFRDKREAVGAGLGSGAYGRLFAGDEATPLGPSVALGPGHDGDRVVVGWAGELAVFAWQETDPDGLPGVILSAVDRDGRIVVERLAIHEPGGARDERPSIAARSRGEVEEVLVVWEAVGASGAGEGIRGRVVAIGR